MNARIASVVRFAVFLALSFGLPSIGWCSDEDPDGTNTQRVHRAGYSAIVYKMDDVVIAQDHLGNEIFSGRALRDDAEAINTALTHMTAGGRLVIEPGTYYLHQTIVIKKSTVVDGLSQDECVLSAWTDLPALIQLRGHGADGQAEGSVLRNFRLDKHAGKTVDYGIQLLNVYGGGTLIENVVVGKGTGNTPGFSKANVHNSVSRYITYHNCALRSSEMYGMLIEGVGSNCINLLNCNMANNKHTNLKVLAGDHLVIIGGAYHFANDEYYDFIKDGGDGIYVGPEYHGALTIIGADLENNGRHALRIEGGEGHFIDVHPGVPGKRNPDGRAVSLSDVHNSIIKSKVNRKKPKVNPRDGIELDDKCSGNLVMTTRAPIRDEGSHNMIWSPANHGFVLPTDEPVGVPPSTPMAGATYFDKVNKRLMIYDGTRWRYLVLSASARAPSAKTSSRRTWTDATGGHRIEAEYLGLAGSQVRLRKEDGSVVSVPLSNLSRQDQDWVRQHTK